MVEGTAGRLKYFSNGSYEYDPLKIPVETKRLPLSLQTYKLRIVYPFIVTPKLGTYTCICPFQLQRGQM